MASKRTCVKRKRGRDGVMRCAKYRKSTRKKSSREARKRIRYVGKGCTDRTTYNTYLMDQFYCFQGKRTKKHPKWYVSKGLKCVKGRGGDGFPSLAHSQTANRRSRMRKMKEHTKCLVES